MFLKLLSAIVCAGIVLTGCSSSEDTMESMSRSATAAVSMKAADDASLIKKGDEIELSVWGYPEFQTKATVNETGTIPIPLVGTISVAGVSRKQFAADVKKKLAEFIQGDADITISVSSPASQRISVLGAVTKQDNYPVASEMSLLETLSAAGGTTVESDLSHIKIIRNGIAGETEEVDLASHLENGSLDNVPKVRPGDVVYVPKKENVVREFSDFLRDAVLIIGSFRVFY